jgi:hypothetical protein
MRILLFCLSAVSILLTACSKEPGEGGRAEIRGRILEQRYSNNTQQPQGQPYPKAEQRVYIIYGDGTYHDDDVRTGPDGTFRFPWLRKGSYNIYTISECGSYNGCTVAVGTRTNITGRKDVVDIGDLTIQNW